MSNHRDKKDKKHKDKKAKSLDSVKISLPSIRPDEVTIQQRLGEGAYGEVYKGVCRQAPVAVKYIKEEKYDPEALLAELTIMFQATSANIVKIQGVLVDEKHCPIGIVSEFLEGGDLEALLHPEDDQPVVNLTLDKKLGYAIDIALGMSWLMGKDVKIIHRDLKPANIMLDKDQTMCKICDFGLAVTNEKNSKGKEGHTGDIKSTRGSPLWMAPERVVIKVMADEELRDSLTKEVAAFTKVVKVDKTASNSSEKSDVYSFGVMLWEIYTQAWPFVDLLTSESFTALFSLILSGKRPSLSGIEPPVAQIIEKCWQNDPAARPSFESCIIMLRDARIELALPASICPTAASFWKSSQGNSDLRVTIQSFVEGLELKGFLRPRLPGETPLNPDLLARAIASVLGTYSTTLPTAEAAKNQHITIHDFGKLLKWFGPMKGASVSCFQHMIALMKDPCFFGQIERQQCEVAVAAQNGKTPSTGSYILRLNNGGGQVPIEAAPFVISTQSSQGKPFHIRVCIPKGSPYGKWQCSSESKQHATDSIQDMITALKGDKTIAVPVLSSPFQGLFRAVEDVGGACYTAAGNFQSTQW